MGQRMPLQESDLPIAGRDEAPTSLAKVVTGFVVIGVITFLAIVFGSALQATFGPLPTWLGIAVALTAGNLLFSVLVSPSRIRQWRRLVLGLWLVFGVVVIGGILLRQRLGLDSHGGGRAVLPLAIVAGYAATRALQRAGATNWLRGARHA
jgi:hypothetical protein